MLSQQRPVAVVLAGVDQELLELLWVLRHLPHGGGDFHEVGAGADHVEDFHGHELHLYLFATNCTNFLLGTQINTEKHRFLLLIFVTTQATLAKVAHNPGNGIIFGGRRLFGLEICSRTFARVPQQSPLGSY